MVYLKSVDVVLTLESVCEIIKCDHSNESYRTVLSCCAVYYAGCPEGAYRVLKRVDFFFFFFVVYTNRYINLFIKLSPLLLGMYCFDCLQQKQANQNPFLSLIS